jgi:mutator protein MutT
VTVTVVAAVIEREGRFLLTRRPAGTHLAGLWEFPGGKVDAVEPHAAALRREMQEELDADVVVGEQVHEVTHSYADRTVRLHFYRCTLAGTPRPMLGQEMAWVDRARLQTLEFPEADRDLIDRLAGPAAR